MARRAHFMASLNGFAFTNSWPHEPAVVLKTPFGDIKVGDAAKGLCGGMTFAALDYWYADAVPPTDRPDPGSPLYKFIVKRIVDSWQVPSGVARYFHWMTVPDTDQTFDAFGRQVLTQRGLPWRTIKQQWPLIKRDLDAGRPSPLGLITIKSAQVSDLGHNHQVLAFDYYANGSAVTLYVYDPNTGQDDGVTIDFDTSAASTATFSHTINISRPVRGFFRTTYAPAAPPTP